MTYIGATGLDSFTDAIDTLSASISIDIINTSNYILETSNILVNTKSNVAIANQINLDAGPLTDALQEIITDSAGTALGELIGTTTQVPSALGQSLITLSALGLLAYNKLNRTSVQDVDSMIYSADYSSILTPAMFDDRVRIRYDTNWFSNAIYYEGSTKKGEILTYRPEQGSNILNLDATNIKLGTIDNARFPTNYGTQLGIGTSPAVNTNLHIYNATNSIIRLETGAEGQAGVEFQRGTRNDVNVDFKIVNDTGRLKFQSQDEVNLYTSATSEIMRLTRTQISMYKPVLFSGNVGIGGTAPPETYKLEITGDVNISAGSKYKIDGVDLSYTNLTNLPTNQLWDYNTVEGAVGKYTTGNVGIGTTPSEYKLDVLGTINATD